MKGSLIATRTPFVVGAVAEDSQTLLLPKDYTLNGKSTRYFDQIAAIAESNKTIPATILHKKQRIST
jgi:hypothetical protein